MPPMHGNAKLLKFISALLISIFLYSNFCDLDVSFFDLYKNTKRLNYYAGIFGKK